MSNIFSKFFTSFGFSKKNKYLPAGSEVESAATTTFDTAIVLGSVPVTESAVTKSSTKPLASFDISIEKPKYQGAIPDATIKFYPID